jgi:hypothetical protein
MYGIEAGVVNATEKLIGLQLGGLVSFATSAPLGVQASFLVNGAEQGNGVQLSGIINWVSKDFRGIQASIANHVEQGSMWGLQVALVNWNGQTMAFQTGADTESWTEYPEARETGIQLALFSKQQNFSGLQIGGGNYERHDCTCVAISPTVNFTETLHGAQVGLINMASEVHGVQIGVANYTKKLRGLQIGAINIATENKLPVMVLANVGF